MTTTFEEESKRKFNIKCQNSAIYLFNILILYLGMSIRRLDNSDISVKQDGMVKDLVKKYVKGDKLTKVPKNHHLACSSVMIMRLNAIEESIYR
jgi:hypothetical protein